jgi:succinyl-diaminopimelate desuccinylase
MTGEVLELTIELCRRPSVTPEDAGCQDLVAAILGAAGFRIERLDAGEVRNLLAVHGDDGPLGLFLGHTDVVPPGPESAWASPPFAPEIRDGRLHARGAADMKGSVAAMTLALVDFVRAHPAHRGRVGLLLTSDEEGPALDGVRHVAQRLVERGDRPAWCVVGEPSSSRRLGDVIRVGRRGSLSGELRVRGVQGHVAYPALARNPIHAFAPALAELAALRWDEGDADFPPTTFQVSNLAAGTGATNVIPGELRASFNFRFGTASGEASLRARVEAILARHGVEHEIAWHLSGAPFHTPPGPLREAVVSACREVLGVEPTADTGGGTSDGRFIAPLGAEVVEVGPVNASIHKVDEHVAVADLEPLRRVHVAILRRLAAGRP